ncbi:phosphate signaling complex protein PhoU [Aquicoccus porphyridii]|uniref:Phosphate-specific transport system accessory protein PhoU n=1 Tax=Aquicoccus porphyridii TaxID=1852029 RepID=A0A5A9YYN3_9RHOB|nr:phosphate signaling complex protein PhoU [Aquicoccus porphyridii]KAA0910043.1 phosphate signaling complex protein PhoU [Aquicoccus porphyridii]RAI52091.1 phosphate transport system regulatory protein PhoU [Rhodobacteraceae bacterium AsT-22]
MNEKHIVSSFDRDLESIQATVMKMGGLVEKALMDAVRALKTHDVELAEAVRKGDKVVDELDLTVKTDTAQLLALRSPTASDLRTVLSVMEIASHLERCGDYAKNMAKRTIAMAESGEINGSLAALGRMSTFVEAMVKDALDAYIQRDTEKAAEIIERDLEADQIYNTLFRSLLTHMMEDHRNITVGMHLHFIAKNIERVGDHATGIAEQTIYLATGEFPEDDRPKLDRTALEYQKSEE